ARLIEKVASKGADAVILDLEDAVAPKNKDAARSQLKDQIESLKSKGLPVLVRINAEPELAAKDINSFLGVEIDGIVVPKVDGAEHLSSLAKLIAGLAASAGTEGVPYRYIPQIESALALPELHAIAAHEGVIGLALGTEDFSLSIGVEPTFDCLELPAKLISLAAASRQIMSLAVPTSISNYTDLGSYQSAAETGKKFGVTGAICVHPNQVLVANDVYKPSADQVAHAKAVLEIWLGQIQSGGAVAVIDGQMIDKPVVLRATRTLSLAGEDVPASSELFPDG
ncbi:MAG: CoA ester lyase, partial [Pseudomonadota bacterium]